MNDAPRTGIRILAIGDSITQGVPFVTVGQTYPEILAKLSGYEIINLGVGGMTVAEMEMNFDQSIDEHQPFLVILMGGVNDIEYGRSPEEIIQDISSIIRKARSKGILLMICTILPGSIEAGLEDSRAHVNVWIRRLPERDRILADTDMALRDSIQTDMLAYKYDSGDRAHPNAEGMKRIAEAIFPVLPKRV